VVSSPEHMCETHGRPGPEPSKPVLVAAIAHSGHGKLHGCETLRE
jgi:hypothetical protein